MKPIIPPISKQALEKELSEDKLLRKTGKADNSIYVVTAADSPDVMREIGRLRELAFRQAGGGTGDPYDIDEDDIAENGYKQLIVWDSAEKEIVGGYRYIVCDSEHPEHLSTEHYFTFSDLFRKKYLPHTIELGRSFIQPAYQNTHKNPKSIFALDNLWDGLGALIVKHPKAKYFFGKVTMYGNYDRRAKNILLYFLRHYCPDEENLIAAKKPASFDADTAGLSEIFTGSDFGENHKILCQTIRALGENVPPLINSYLGLSPTMKVFDTALNPDFGDVEETGILVTIKDIYPSKTERHTKWNEVELA